MVELIINWRSILEHERHDVFRRSYIRKVADVAVAAVVAKANVAGSKSGKLLARYVLPGSRRATREGNTI